MNRYFNEKSNYDKYPVVNVPGMEEECRVGWRAISDRLEKDLSQIGKKVKVVVLECYQGVSDEEVVTALQSAFPASRWFFSADAMKSPEQIDAILKQDITEDEIFGYMTRQNMDCYFDGDKLPGIRSEIAAVTEGIVFVYGVGAAYVQPSYDLLVYADMARWEIQMRFRRNEVSNVGISNREERASLQYKRAFFVDWRICDRFKKKLMKKWDYVLDTNTAGNPKMATAKAIEAGLEKASRTPFGSFLFSIRDLGADNG